MNTKLRQIGFLAIVPLALLILSPNLVSYADAANVGSIDVIGRVGYQPDKVCGDKLCSESASAKSAKNEMKLSKSTGGVEYDALSAQLAEKSWQLTIANANGDFDKVVELQDELKDLRNQIDEWKNNSNHLNKVSDKK